jgi:hypothetical protein
MKRRRELIVLVVLLAVFAVVAWYQWTQATKQERAGGALSANAARRGGRQAQAVGVPAVRLDALAAARKAPPPRPSERNLFQFQAKAAPPPPKPLPGQPGGAGVNAAGQPSGPPPPPPPPPIQLKFIGIVQSPSQKLAVLTDPNTRDVFYGREGDIVDGRFRILRIGLESIEMAYVDGRGRQSIRLSGS